MGPESVYIDSWPVLFVPHSKVPILHASGSPLHLGLGWLSLDCTGQVVLPALDLEADVSYSPQSRQLAYSENLD